MNVVVREWIDKAERDSLTAVREAAAEPPNYDAVCFYAQQSVEKLFKALLTAMGTMPPKTHDLTVLSQLLSSVFPEWKWPVEPLRLLSSAAVAFRYPGELAGPREADAALGASKDVRVPLLKLLAETDA